MKYRRLGESSLLVSEIALGSWLTYSGGVDAETSRNCVHTALDLGINFIDTANIYGRGAAETLLGETLASVPRDKYVLATKLYFPMTDKDRACRVLKSISRSMPRSLASKPIMWTSSNAIGSTRKPRSKKQCKH